MNMLKKELVRRRRAASRGFSSALYTTAARVGKVLNPSLQPFANDVEVIKDLRYKQGDDPMHLMDVYRPRSVKGPLPVLFYIHGGGFQILNKDSHWLMGVLFARAGYLVYNISYRLAPENPYPAAVEDTCDAFVWAYSQIEAYGGDPTRIAIAGESAGGNLTSALTLACCHPQKEEWAKRVFDLGVTPKVAIPMCGMLQTSNPQRYEERDMHWYFIDRIMSVCQNYNPSEQNLGPMCDPLLWYEGDEETERPLPAFFVPCGGIDAVVEDSERLGAALEKRGLDAVYKPYPGETHAFMAMIWRDQAKECWDDIFAFLNPRMGVKFMPPKH